MEPLAAPGRQGSTLPPPLIVVCKSTLGVDKVAIQFLVLARAAPAFNSTGISAPSEQMCTSELDCDFVTPLVDLEGPKNRLICEGSLGRKKVDGC